MVLAFCNIEYYHFRPSKDLSSVKLSQNYYVIGKLDEQTN